MLRRTQSIVLKEENEPEPPAPEAPPRRAPEPEPRPDPVVASFVERRRSDRRGMDALRAEALRAVISRVEDRNFGGLRDRVSWPARLKASRLVLLLVALVAGGLAAYLATQREATAPASAPAAVEIVAAPTARVLVATSQIFVGQRLSDASVGWAEWPLSTVNPQYITEDVAPDAIAEVSGAVARSGFLAGEPIRSEKLVEATGGYLSAVLGEGKRGVSVMVAAQTASGGFIAPNDHVDVLLTRITDGAQHSDTVLRNVRVIAINSQLGDSGTVPGAPSDQATFTGSAIATLELDPTEAEVITAASTMGQLTLVLRSAVDAMEPLQEEHRAANQAIRLTSPFWKQ